MNILITGGASGLGEAITTVAALAHPTATVYFTYHTSHQNAIAIQDKYINTRAIKCDFSSKADMEALCLFIETNTINILVNNAIAGLAQQYFHKITKEEFTNGFAANVLPVIAIAKSFIAKARKIKSGKIITILSSAIINTPPTGWSAYTAEKNYLLAMHKSWALENAAFNITSNCISPGFMDTHLNHATDARVVEDLIAKHPLKKLLTTTEVADVVLFLINASSYVNGNNIIIFGPP